VKVTAYCDECLAKSRFDASQPPVVLACGRCRRERSISPTDSVRLGNRLDRCPVCASGYFYREKDFNAWAGGAVILAAIAGFLVMADRNIAIALGILMAAAALDLFVYAVVPFRYICYKCLASMHGAVRDPAIGPYDLGTAGRFADDYEGERGKPRDP
jgi:hypothetical protein